MRPTAASSELSSSALNTVSRSLVEREVEHELERVPARRARELRHRALLELGARRLDDLDLVPFAVEQAEVRRLGDFSAQRVAKFLFAQFPLERIPFQRKRGLPCLQALRTRKATAG